DLSYRHIASARQAAGGKFFGSAGIQEDRSVITFANVSNTFRFDFHRAYQSPPHGSPKLVAANILKAGAGQLLSKPPALATEWSIAINDNCGITIRHYASNLGNVAHMAGPWSIGFGRKTQGFGNMTDCILQLRPAIENRCTAMRDDLHHFLCTYLAGRLIRFMQNRPVDIISRRSG